MQRIIEKLDEYLNKNDMAGAERHLLYWLAEKGDTPAALPLLNELMGIYRKTGREKEAKDTLARALGMIDAHNLGGSVTAATTHLNAATVLSAFGSQAEAIPHFEVAKRIYDDALPEDDPRRAGLYNNMATALADTQRYQDAYTLYHRAIALLQARGDGALNIAITYLNIANAKEKELGALAAEEEIHTLLENARHLLDEATVRDGYYAFVAEKCASVFGYFGWFLYEKELRERVDTIYAGS